MKAKAQPVAAADNAPEPLTSNQKIKVLHDDPEQRKNRKSFATLTPIEKRRVLDAMDVSISPAWIEAEINDLLDQREVSK